MKCRSLLILAFTIFSLVSLFRPAAFAQTEAETHRTVIEAFYPAMIQAVADGNFAKARILCRQAIDWEPSQFVHHYNLACIEAKASSPDQAFIALTQAVALGYADVESLKADADLESIRNDQRFKDLLPLVERNAHRATGNAASIPTPTTPAPSPTEPAPTTKSVATTPLPKEVPPVPAKIANGKPEGLFFMTRYWSFTGTLEKAVWYFSPTGEVYQNLLDGFSPQDLAAHKGRKGTLKAIGNNLEVTWSDGKTTKSEFEPDKGEPSFAWDGGLFSAVEPFRDAKSIVGKYEGGESSSFGGNYAAFSRTFDLRADGTFSRESVGSVSSKTSESKVSAGSVGNDEGTWKLSDYSLTLTDKNGKSTRKIAFPYDDEKTPAYPDRFFFGGTMFKRQ